MLGKIAVEKLKAHPKNTHYFTDLDGDKYEEVKRSIETNGIRDPIKCTTAYTVISGHQRLRIAKELGLEEVPVQIVDVDEWEAEYLLIAENVERRGQAETDPIKKSRIANFLKEYWGVHRGGDRKSKEHNAPLKTNKDIGEVIGESEYQTKRILKLNDLIPSLQDLVSEGKLGTTAAEQLAYMTPENQQTLLDVIGEKISETTVKQAKEYRQEADYAVNNDGDYADRLQKLEDENLLLQHKLEKSKIENQTHREKIKELENNGTTEDTERIRSLEKNIKSYEARLNEVQSEKEKLERELKVAAINEEQIETLEQSIASLSDQREALEQKLKDISEIQGFISEIDRVRSEGMSPIVYSRAIQRLTDESIVMDDLQEAVDAVGKWYQDMQNILTQHNPVVDEVFIDG